MAKKINREALRPMPWRDFVLGFQTASQALDDPQLGELPSVDPTDPAGARLREAELAVSKDPFLRVLLAAQTHFGEGYAYLGCFVYRFWALLHLLRRGHLNEWITVDEETGFQNFHPAVLLAAAEARLNDKARFPPRQFAQKIRSIVAEETGEPSA